MEKSTAILNSTSMFVYIENFYNPEMISLYDWGTSIELTITYKINSVNVDGIMKQLRLVVPSECGFKKQKRTDLENEYLRIYWNYDDSKND